MEVYWHGLTFLVVIIIIVILIMEIVNYCTLNKLKSEFYLLAQSELYDLAPYGNYYPNYYGGRCKPGYRGISQYYYNGPCRKPRRSSTSPRRSSKK